MRRSTTLQVRKTKSQLNSWRSVALVQAYELPTGRKRREKRKEKITETLTSAETNEDGSVTQGQQEQHKNDWDTIKLKQGLSWKWQNENEWWKQISRGLLHIEPSSEDEDEDEDKKQTRGERESESEEEEAFDTHAPLEEEGEETVSSVHDEELQEDGISRTDRLEARLERLESYIEGEEGDRKQRQEEEEEEEEAEEEWTENDSVTTEAANTQLLELSRQSSSSNSYHHHALDWDTVHKYDSCAKFLKANVLTLRSSLVRTNEGVERGGEVDVGYTRDCLERAETAAEIAKLLDRVRDLLPVLNKPMLQTTTTATHQREQRVREAAKNYGQHQRQTAKLKLKRIKTNAKENRAKYFALRRVRAEGGQTKMGGATSVMTAPRKTRSKRTRPEDERGGESERDFLAAVAAIDAVDEADEADEADGAVDDASSSEHLQRQHRADRLAENRILSSRFPSWDDSSELGSDGLQGVSRPRLLKTGQRALSPLLSSSKTSSDVLLAYAASSTGSVSSHQSPLAPLSPLSPLSLLSSAGSGSGGTGSGTGSGGRRRPRAMTAAVPSLYYDLTIPIAAGGRSDPKIGRVTATVPSHIVSPKNPTGAYSFGSDEEEGSGKRSRTTTYHRRVHLLLRAIPDDQKDRLVRVCLVELKEKSSKIKSQRWNDLEDVLTLKDLEKESCTPAPIDATTVRQTLRDLMSPVRAHLRMSSSPKKFSSSDYVPYALRKSPGKISNRTALTQNVLQRQVAKQQQARSDRIMRVSAREKKNSSPIERQQFERNVHRNMHDQKWRKEYKHALHTSKEFMEKRNAPRRKKQEDEERRAREEEHERKVQNTVIPTSVKTKYLLRREIRMQARLELTEKEMDEIENLWKEGSWPNRKPGKVNVGNANGGGSGIGGEGVGHQRGSPAVAYGESVRQALEKKLNQSIDNNNELIRQAKMPVFEGNKYPSVPVDPSTYSHLFDDSMTDYSAVTPDSLPGYEDEDY